MSKDKKYRIGIISIKHESNTFLAKKTRLEDFKSTLFLRGEEVYKMRPGFEEIAGFIQTLEKESDVEIVPLFVTYATPSGIVEAGVIESLWKILEEELSKAGRFDGLVVAPHGAGVSESQRDMDGWWLTQLRNHVGSDTIIVSSLDPHGNVSEAMITACNATISCRTNPHIDQFDRGVEAARLVLKAVRKEVKLTQAFSFPGVAINIERQLTSAHPIRLLTDKMDELRKLPGVLSINLMLGFPYADVAEMGSGFIVTTDNNESLAKKLANELGAFLYDHREKFRGEMISLETALDQVKNSVKPVCLLDMGDNAGGGSAGDGTFIAHALHQRADLKGFICLFDPQSVKEAQAAGIGKKCLLKMGGKVDGLHGKPLEAEVTVQRFHDGKFKETQVRHGGKLDYDMGPSVIVTTTSGITILLTTRKMTPYSFQQFLSCGLDPKDFDVIVAKGVHAPVAAYQEDCPTFIRVNTQGATSAEMEKFSYKYRRKPLFPFEDFKVQEKTKALA